MSAADAWTGLQSPRRPMRDGERQFCTRSNAEGRFFAQRPGCRRPTAEMGHEDQFRPPSLSVGYRIGQRTFAAPSSIGCRAPIPAIRGQWTGGSDRFQESPFDRKICDQAFEDGKGQADSAADLEPVFLTASMNARKLFQVFPCAAGEVKEEARLLDARVRHEPTQPSVAKRCPDQRLEDICDSQPGESQIDGVVRISGDYCAAHADGDIGSVFASQAPGINAAARSQTERDAVVTGQIGDRTRLSPASK